MRNQLTQQSTTIPELVYVADGKLDNHPITLSAWSKSRATLDFGPCSLSLTPQALIELIGHLHKAMDALVQSYEQEARP